MRGLRIESKQNPAAGCIHELAHDIAALVRIPTGINPHAYGACLQIKGHDPARTTRLVATSPANSLHIASEVNAAFYESCVNNQIDVEVFVPTAALD